MTNPAINIQALILLSGPIAVGKTTVRQTLVSTYGFEYVRSSEYLSSILKKQGLESSRTSLQNLGDDLDRKTDFRWVVDDVARPAILALPDAALWLMDAVRKARQVEHFRQAFECSILHVHLTASEDVLRQRFSARQNSATYIPYEVAVQHENEVASRALLSLADFVLDSGNLSPEQIADKVLVELARRRRA